ncbi:MAG: hypothetical protein V4592_12510 [Bacteroidota bacterium]
MKKLILILLALCPVVLKAQSNDKLLVKDLNVLPVKGLLHIVDGKKMSAEEYNAIPRGNIQSFSFLSDSAGKAQYGAEGASGVMFITTNSHSIPSYMDRFMALSTDYKAYLNSHSNFDKEFIYVLDEIQLPNDQNRFKLLDNIPNDKIVSVTVMHNEPGLEKGLTRIHITTKK